MNAGRLSRTEPLALDGAQRIVDVFREVDGRLERPRRVLVQLITQVWLQAAHKVGDLVRL
jgi:hypothetical protein